MKGKETKHTAAFSAQHKKPTETVELFLEGWIGEMMGKGKDTQQNGAFILTNERACFYRKGVFGEVLETMPISKITSVEIKSFMGHRVLRLHTSHDALAFKTFEAKEFFDPVYERIEQLRHPPSTAESGAPPAAASQDIIGQLEKLASLHAAGILTDQEFTNKKAEMLARL